MATDRRDPATHGEVWAIVVAAGSGRRFGRPKQFELIGDRRVVDHSAAVADEVCDGVVVVYPPTDAAEFGGVAGGRTRAESVSLGLAEVPPSADVICVHDGARPFASATLYRAVIAAVRAGADGAVPGLAVTDTIKRVVDGQVIDTPPRAQLFAVQTPQAFRAAVLRDAHRHASSDADAAAATDDAALVERRGGRVVVVPGDPMNRKITHPEDLDWARRVVDVGDGLEP